MSDMALLGIDVSRHQGVINWQAVRQNGNVFAFCKATDGTSYPYVGYYLAQAPLIRAAGLVLGAYHWLQPGDGAAQARYFVSVVGDFSGVLAVVDYERNPSGTYASMATLRAFAAEFGRLTGGHPLIVYTGRWFWVGVIGDPFGADIGPLWHSEYETTDAEIADGPELDNYGGWPGATFWQYTSSGSVPGVAGACDRNLFYGSLGDLLALTGAQASPSPPTPPEDDDMFVLYNPNNTFWLVTDSSTVQISGDCYNRLTNAGVKAVAPLADDAANIINATTWSQRLQPGTGGDVAVDRQVVEDAVREVFADAGQE